MKEKWNLKRLGKFRKLLSIAREFTKENEKFSEILKRERLL
ncbi:MAG: hypothetical protein ABGX27_02365 [Desulfurobacteriaceae bacterium]